MNEKKRARGNDFNGDLDGFSSRWIDKSSGSTLAHPPCAHGSGLAEIHVPSLLGYCHHLIYPHSPRCLLALQRNGFSPPSSHDWAVGRTKKTRFRLTYLEDDIDVIVVKIEHGDASFRARNHLSAEAGIRTSIEDGLALVAFALSIHLDSEGTWLGSVGAVIEDQEDVFPWVRNPHVQVHVLRVLIHQSHLGRPEHTQDLRTLGSGVSENEEKIRYPKIPLNISTYF